jgi:hypothetical protein
MTGFEPISGVNINVFGAETFLAVVSAGFSSRGIGVIADFADEGFVYYDESFFGGHVMLLYLSFEKCKIKKIHINNIDNLCHHKIKI